jgi:hypothetical protein
LLDAFQGTLHLGLNVLQFLHRQRGNGSVSAGQQVVLGLEFALRGLEALERQHQRAEIVLLDRALALQGLHFLHQCLALSSQQLGLRRLTARHVRDLDFERGQERVQFARGNVPRRLVAVLAQIGQQLCRSLVVRLVLLHVLETERRVTPPPLRLVDARLGPPIDGGLWVQCQCALDGHQGLF